MKKKEAKKLTREQALKEALSGLETHKMPPNSKSNPKPPPGK